MNEFLIESVKAVFFILMGFIIGYLFKGNQEKKVKK